MPMAQRQRSTTVSAQESMVLVRNLMRTSVSTVTYLRNVFPEDSYTDRVISGVGIKSLVANNDETRTVIDWLEKGVFDALQKQFLRVLSLVVTDYNGGVIENYDFRVSYPASGAAVAVSASSSQGGAPTKTDVAASMKAMLRKVIVLTQSMQPLPEERCITMKLVYDKDTPEEYEAPYFREASEEARKQFTRERNVVNLKLGQVKTEYHVMDLRAMAPTHLLEEPAESAPAASQDPGAPPAAAASQGSQPVPPTAHGLYSLLDSRATTAFHDRALQAYMLHGVVRQEVLTPEYLAEALDIPAAAAAKTAALLKKWDLCDALGSVPLTPATKAHVEKILAARVELDLTKDELAALEERLIDVCRSASRKRAGEAADADAPSQTGLPDSIQAYGDGPKISEIDRSPLKQFRRAADTHATGAEGAAPAAVSPCPAAPTWQERHITEQFRLIEDLCARLQPPNVFARPSSVLHSTSSEQIPTDGAMHSQALLIAQRRGPVAAPRRRLCPRLQRCPRRKRPTRRSGASPR
eukprot:TRINITY_DN1030_c0_g1_i8.p1 TRINITY_DN1030_c0_g1~~TRINITY_DN1030_c0_g1_i8.p1  ORF type:complete len:525 (+),score=151.55 TRINITY_DN1030_c0_g1_i8:73-1647(+)